MTTTIALREALNQGISSGNFIDTKIVLYSRRDSSGRVCRPRALYANSHVLRTIPWFNDLLFGSFSESQSKRFDEEEIDDGELAKNYEYFSDSDLEDGDEDQKVSSFKHTNESRVHPFDPFGVPGEDSRTIREGYEERVEIGKVVKIPDMAFVTFQAFLMYLYTNVIEFAPYRSDVYCSRAEIDTPSDDKVPRPSPKSIYRLADKYDAPALKSLALNHIRGELAKCDIVEESFSSFTSMYDEVRNLYIGRLASAWMEDSTTEAIRASVERKIDKFSRGDLGHAAEVLTGLWEIANKSGNIVAHPPSSPPSAAQPTGPARSVKIALIRSMRKGVLFDKKYWARNSRTGGALKPVYFSSIVMGDKVQQLKNLTKYLKGRDALINGLENGVNFDSDCEGDSTGAGDGTLEEQNEEESRAVLIAGSFSAWKSLFFYRCTGVISFAPLKSQGADSRLNHIREKTVAAAPPPCSPKSIYVLASLLGIQPLCDNAFGNIQSKVSTANVVTEVFSRVTAGQERIVEMECELLNSNFNDPGTIAAVKQSIGYISTGSVPYCAGALKLGVKKAFEVKKRKRSVWLRCTRIGCMRHATPISYSAIGSAVYCTVCLYQYGPSYLQCTGCFYNRTFCGSGSCLGCGNKFS